MLVFNGEIYNYQSVRERLTGRGHRFRTASDTEVLLHSYDEYGAGMFDHLRGMFGLALYDTVRKRLLLARDRIGIKPLYYTRQNGRLVFGSEIKSILQDPSVERQVNHQALYDYLGFEFVPAPETMFAGISKLPAGHLLVWENGQASVRRYWDLSFRPAAPMPRFEEAVEQLREQLDTAVKSHLVSDVPLGVFLSGGLDSSCLVALMRRHISGPLKTFTSAKSLELFPSA